MELVIVVVIIGILAGVALPSFINTREKALDKEAVAGLLMIVSGNRQFFARNELYYPSATENCATYISRNLSVELPAVHWNFSITPGGAGCFTARAVRRGGTREWRVTGTIGASPACFVACL